MRYVLIVLYLTACAAERQPWEFFGSVEEESELVVDGVLLVDQTLPDLFVRRTLPLAAAVRLDSSYVFDPADIDSTGRLVRPSHSTYSREAAGVPDARVHIVEGDQVFEYAPDPVTPGRYLPPPDPPQVEALTEYRLEVDVEGKKVRASTTTPDRMRVRQAVLLDEDTQEIMRTLKSFAEVGDEVYTAPENQLTHLEGLDRTPLGKGGGSVPSGTLRFGRGRAIARRGFPGAVRRGNGCIAGQPIAALRRQRWNRALAVVRRGFYRAFSDKGVRTRPQLVRVRPLQPRSPGTGRICRRAGRRKFRAAVLSGRGRHRAVWLGVGGFGGVCRFAATVTGRII